jgi:hypothetical protein
MIDINVQEKFPSMTPAKAAPALFRINGCGVAMCGSRNHDAETGTYVSTWCLSLLFIPVFCLRAYRVAKSGNRWLFIGREPLSTLAKAWDMLLVLVVAAAIGAVAYAEYTSSPAYAAQRQMEAARSLAGQGRVAQAAAIYQRLAAANADQAPAATKALGELLDGPCRQAPLGECAAVFASAAQIAHRDGAVGPQDVMRKGMDLAAGRSASDPPGAMALLDAIRPLAVDTRPIDARRLPILRQWAAAEPNNLDALCPLASLLEEQDQLDEAKNLLLPVRARLGDGEGARVLGTILASQGDYDGAYALLWPYAKLRLDRLHEAEKAADATVNELHAQQIKALNDNKAPADFYTRYRNAGKQQQEAMVQDYVHTRIRNDPRYTNAIEALRREKAVVPVAMELGMVMLQRAQGQSDPLLRKTQLESAEKVFLAIGGFAGESDEYRLSLGQVYYWLGKQADGRKLFDEFLAAKGRNTEALLAISSRMRQLGAMPEARAMAEEAYTKAAKDEERYAAADFRAACDKDLDDKIVWLNKADTANPAVKAKLADALGTKAVTEGRDSDAAAQYRAAIDAYAAMPRNATALNESARAWVSIFWITGDRQALDRGVENFQQALELSPSDAILLGNAAAMLAAAALGDVIGTDIDLRALHETGEFSLLAYLYQDSNGHDAVARRVKEHPGIARALSYYEKLMVMSPKSTGAYAAAFRIHRYTRNDKAAETLAQRIEAADFDTADGLASLKEFLSGVKDEQIKIQTAASLKRTEETVDKLRAKGGRTLAVALGQQVEALLYRDMISGDADPQKAVALAEEAHGASPSAATSSVLAAAYLLRACKDLCRTEPALASFRLKYNRSIGVSYLLAAAAAEAGPLQQKIAQNADVQKVLSLLREENKLFPDSPVVYGWALMKNANPAEAATAAEAIRKNPRTLAGQLISVRLAPANAAEALETSWVLEICGKPAEARSALRKVADLGLPVPVQP